ncbi:ABC transporter substrate-binding protein [Celerinatantimonas sp. YJH-8]|uniref:ABC transporter substrate-binding protein n=1 Tax=Celerinatantimonas sp. YJH-8 TaxID=3228714 RepID=UPI0038C57F4D
MTDSNGINRRQFLGGMAILAGATLIPWSNSLQASEIRRKGGKLRISVDQAVSVLNPLKVRVNPEYLVAELLYSGLTRLRPDMKVEADLAESWQANDDLTIWTFNLRKNLKFHDGSDCNANDVAASLNAILDPKTAATGRKNIGPIQSVQAHDAHTVTITLSQPYADLPIALAYPSAKIVSAQQLKAGIDSLAQHANGTGPFKLVSYEPERLIRVEKNPDFYDPNRPHLDGVDVVVYPDSTAAGSALISGDIDLMMAISADDYQRFQNSQGVKPLRVASGQFLNINMGCDQKPFNDVRVRKALALAVDREALLQFVAGGFATAGNDTPVNAAYQYFAKLAQRHVDLAQAKSLLKQAGYANGLDITLVASDKPETRAQLAIAVREMAKPAGFNINVETMAHATYLSQVWKKGNFYVGFYNMQPTVDSIFSLLYTSDAPWNETRWNNAQFDAAVKAAQKTTDPAKRTQFYATAQQLMHDEIPSVIPTFFDILAAERDYVQGYQLHPRGAVFRLDEVWFGKGAPTRS